MSTSTITPEVDERTSPLVAEWAKREASLLEANDMRGLSSLLMEIAMFHAYQALRLAGDAAPSYLCGTATVGAADSQRVLYLEARWESAVTTPSEQLALKDAEIARLRQALHEAGAEVADPRSLDVELDAAIEAYAREREWGVPTPDVRAATRQRMLGVLAGEESDPRLERFVVGYFASSGRLVSAREWAKLQRCA